MITFEDEEAGKKIFENWIKEFGKTDVKEQISISIIKGVRKENPHWYKVLVSKNTDTSKSKNLRFITTVSRIHMMQPNDSKNLNNLIRCFNHFKSYTLFPAYIDKNFKMKPFPELGIFKTKLKIVDAWNIGLNDLESVAITLEDDPVIPADITNAPVLEVLKRKLN